MSADFVNITAGQLMTSAVDLARQGYTMMRCRPAEKFPVDEWKSSMSADPDVVAAWWDDDEQWNPAMVAMPSGVFVLDVDGPKGEQALADLTEKHGRLPKTIEVRTPGRGGGRHLWFRAPEGQQLLARIKPGLDIKHNGYVLVPPAVHPDGGIYRWNNRSALADAPDWLLKLAIRAHYDDMAERTEPPRKIGGFWERLGDWFDSTFSCQDVMVHVLREQDVADDGWKYTGFHSGNHAYVRPGKAIRDGTSLVVYGFARQAVRPCRNHTSSCAKCAFTRAQMFSTSDPDTPAGSYGPFRLLVHTMYHDDWNAAVTDIERLGFKGLHWTPPPRSALPAAPPVGEGKPRFIGVSAATIVPKLKQWIIPSLVPKAELTLITGKPGGGKSTVMIDLVARITRGDGFPTGAGHLAGVPSRVIMCMREEDNDSVVLPRLMAAGADLDRIIVKPTVIDPTTGEFRDWDLRWLAQMEESILNDNVALVVFDPIKGFMNHRDDNSELDVRREIQPIVDLCHRTKVTAIGVRHTKKNPSEASSAGAGSQAYYALCRSELLITQELDYDGTKLHVLSVNKSSYTASGMRLDFHIVANPQLVRHPDTGLEVLDDAPGKVVWNHGISYVSDPDDVLAPKTDRSAERIFQEAAIRTLTGAAAVGYSLEARDFRRMIKEHLANLEFEGGTSEVSLLKYEKILQARGVVGRKLIHRGAAQGNLSQITLSEPFRARHAVGVES